MDSPRNSTGPPISNIHSLFFSFSFFLFFFWLQPQTRDSYSRPTSSTYYLDVWKILRGRERERCGQRQIPEDLIPSPPTTVPCACDVVIMFPSTTCSLKQLGSLANRNVVNFYYEWLAYNLILSNPVPLSLYKFL